MSIWLVDDDVIVLVGGGTFFFFFFFFFFWQVSSVWWGFVCCLVYAYSLKKKELNSIQESCGDIVNCAGKAKCYLSRCKGSYMLGSQIFLGAFLSHAQVSVWIFEMV